MTTQPEALRIAAELEYDHEIQDSSSSLLEGAGELRRLYQLAEEQHTEIYGLRLQVRNLTATLSQLRAMSADFGAHTACEVASAAIAKATGEQP